MSDLIELTLRQTKGIYAVDAQGNPWVTVRYQRGDKPHYRLCPACHRRYHRGYLRRNTGTFLCPAHVRLVGEATS